MSEINKPRKILYYVGLCLIIIGIITFLSTFLSFFNLSRTINLPNVNFATPYNPLVSRSFSATNSFLPAFIGIILTWIGSAVMNVGKKGLAGSGVILDPKKAREDLKPYSRQIGGMVQDAFEELDTTTITTTIVKIRCNHCKSLNDEDSKFCKSCGMTI